MCAPIRRRWCTPLSQTVFFSPALPSSPFFLSLSLSPFHQTKSMGHVCLQFDRFPVRPSLFDYNVNADAITIRVSDSIRPNERHCNTVAHTKKETAVRWELKKKVEEHIQTHRHTHTHTRQSVSQFVKPLWMNRRHKCERE